MDDLPVMLKIYQHARELMAANGNPTQWGNTFPREEVILDDIRQQRTMLLVDEADGKERVLAQFALCTGEDPTDTHPNNKAMQHVLESNGFARCGLIQLLDRPTDTTRIAYQRHEW